MATRIPSPTSTRVLLSCAAIAVIGGVAFAANLVLLQAVMAVVPPVGAVFAAIGVLAPMIAVEVLRRRGVALLTSVLSALLAFPFSPVIFPILGSVLLGVLLELPFAVGRYRHWGRARTLIGGALSGVLLAAIHYQLWGIAHLTPLVGIVTIVLVIVGGGGWALLGSVIGRRVRPAIVVAEPVQAVNA